MTGAHEKNVHRLAERKGFRLTRWARANSASPSPISSGGRMVSGVPDHEYLFSLQEAERWLASRDERAKGTCR